MGPYGVFMIQPCGTFRTPNSIHGGIKILEKLCVQSGRANKYDKNNVCGEVAKSWVTNSVVT